LSLPQKGTQICKEIRVAKGRQQKLKLSAADRENLGRYENKLQFLRDTVTGVAKGYVSGAIVTGRGGISKSYTIIDQLEKLGVPKEVHNSRLTGRGLVEKLASNPDAVHLVEDCERALSDPDVNGVLRSATWGNTRNREGKTQRIVTWNVSKNPIEVEFTGGIIIASNRRLSESPVLTALASRLVQFDFHVSDGEIAALIRHVAMEGLERGIDRLTPNECLEVAECLIDQSTRAKQPLNMRYLETCFGFRLQCKAGDSGCSWRDRIASLLSQKPLLIDPIKPLKLSEQKRAQQLAVAEHIRHLPPKERLEKWKELTGSCAATMYRRLAEPESIDDGSCSTEN
jgi:hypothetical protein